MIPDEVCRFEIRNVVLQLFECIRKHHRRVSLLHKHDALVVARFAEVISQNGDQEHSLVRQVIAIRLQSGKWVFLDNAVHFVHDRNGVLVLSAENDGSAVLLREVLCPSHYRGHLVLGKT